MNLKSMSASELIDLRERVEAVLSAKVRLERTALEASLHKLDRLGGRKNGRSGARSALAGRKVTPKYRGPNGETWTGRGLKPRWLAAALKGGNKIEQFLIVNGRGRRKGRAAKA
jgi:DNA-binding protein H-NS